MRHPYQEEEREGEGRVGGKLYLFTIFILFSTIITYNHSNLTETVGGGWCVLHPSPLSWYAETDRHNLTETVGGGGGSDAACPVSQFSLPEGVRQ